jgi:hypothetical protein
MASVAARVCEAVRRDPEFGERPIAASGLEQPAHTSTVE